MKSNDISQIFRRVQAKGALHPEEFLRLQEMGMPLRRALAIVTPWAYSEILAAMPLPLFEFLGAVRREEVQTWMKGVFDSDEAHCSRCGHINALHPCEHCWETIQPKVSEWNGFEMHTTERRCESFVRG
jgi:hypothetical protein